MAHRPRRRRRRHRQRPFRDRRHRQCAATITAQPPPSPSPPLSSPPPPSLIEELVEEILLRLPAQEPASLVRAALVCKPWRRIVTSVRFRRRFLEFHHRTPPMLGFICNYARGGLGSTFVRAAASPLLQGSLSTRWYRWCALDARHGRVLLRPPGRMVPVRELVVWDPVTDEHWELPALPPRPTVSCTAAVVCAAAAATAGACNHLGCHRGPFRVVFVGTDAGSMFVCTYSSDAGAWSEPISIRRPRARYAICGGYTPSVLLGNELYFGIEEADAVLKYDLEKHGMLWIQLPRLEYGFQSSVLTTMDDGRLGLVRVLDGVLRFWWLRLTMDAPKASAQWIEFKVVNLRTLTLPDVRPSFVPKASVVGFADGLGVVFVAVEDTLYTVDLKTCVVKKVYNGIEMDTVFPYMRIYSPALEAASSRAEEEPSAAGSCA